ncbi:MAG: hypothetical protein JXQ80_12950 [Bacteroidales bacterium]|nr:hypothetical protein [Bacteroidales bacterium]
MSIVFDILRTVKGYQALPYVPADIITQPSGMSRADYNKGDGPERAKQSATGATLRKVKNGIWYFMPVSFTHKGKRWEFDEAVVSITGKKTIVETPMVGRKGSVKELISVDDYDIKLVAVLESTNGDYPEQEMQELVRLWEINEAIKMSCALTDYFLKEDDSVMIKTIEPITVEGQEDIQAFNMTLVSDSPFELEL